jgi:hypothetical protein
MSVEQRLRQLESEIGSLSSRIESQITMVQNLIRAETTERQRLSGLIDAVRKETAVLRSRIEVLEQGRTP